MFWPFMDRDSTTLVVTNGGSALFTAPYRCLVIISNVRCDDTGGFQVIVKQTNSLQSPTTRWIEIANGSTVQSGSAFGDPIFPGAVGAYVLQDGQELRLDAADDVRATLWYFRLNA